jgi:hypothetical protein
MDASLPESNGSVAELEYGKQHHDNGDDPKRKVIHGGIVAQGH